MDVLVPDNSISLAAVGDILRVVKRLKRDRVVQVCDEKHFDIGSVPVIG